jgi:hypothetical protein
MSGDRRRHVVNLPARLLQSKAEVKVLSIHEVIGIESTDPLDRGAPHHEACCRPGIDLVDLVVRQVAEIVCVELAALGKEPARMGGAFIYDPVRHVSVLFGGGAPGGTDELCDTWTFDGSRWTQQHPATSPSPREFSTVAFDSHLGVIVRFGGYAAQSGLNDLWTWDGTNWTQLASAASPPNLFPLGLGYRQSDDSLFLAGQSSPGGNGFS